MPVLLCLCSCDCARRLSRILEGHILFPLQPSGRRVSWRAGERAHTHTAGSYSHSDALGSSASLGARRPCAGVVHSQTRHYRVAAGCSLASQQCVAALSSAPRASLFQSAWRWHRCRWPRGQAIGGCGPRAPHTLPSTFRSSARAYLPAGHWGVDRPPARAPARSLPRGQRRRGRSGDAELACRTAIADSAAWGGAAA